jgi:peroxiredoxin Q/BCP
MDLIEKMDLIEGNKAPDFTLENQDKKQVSLKDFEGKKVVLFFYPKDDTPGCTKESIEFSERLSNFEKKGAVILGISADSVSSHQSFCSKYQLNITLLSDTEKKVIQQYGIWKEKKMYGKVSMGIARTTFLIDESQHIVKIWNSVKPEGHAQSVLESL